MEFDIGAEFFLDLSKDVKSAHHKLDKMGAAFAKPIHKPVGGTAFQAVAGTLEIVIDQTPSAGRLWNILDVGIFGADGHTPPVANSTFVVTNTYAAGAAGSVQAPAGNTIITGFSVTMAPTASTVTGTVTVSNIGGSLIYDFVANATQGGLLTVQFPTPIIGGAGVRPKVQISAIASGAAGNLNIYGTTATGTVIADVYTGTGLLVPDFNSQMASNLAVPQIVFFPRRAKWVSKGDSIFALAYNVPANTQLSLVAHIADYPIEAEEALSI